MLVIGLVVSFGLFEYRAYSATLIYFFSIELLATYPISRIKDSGLRKNVFVYFGVVVLLFMLYTGFKTKIYEWFIVFIGILNSQALFVLFYRILTRKLDLKANTNKSTSEKSFARNKFCVNCKHSGGVSPKRLTCMLTNVPTRYDLTCEAFEYIDNIPTPAEEPISMSRIDFFILFVILVIHWIGVMMARDISYCDPVLVVFTYLAFNMACLLPLSWMKRKRMKQIVYFCLASLYLVALLGLLLNSLGKYFRFNADFANTLAMLNIGVFGYGYFYLRNILKKVN